MTTAIFAVAAFFIGATLGLRFKVLVLIPAATVSFAAIIVFGFVSGSGPGYIMFVLFLSLTVLQFGYVTGAILGSFAVKTRERNDPCEIVAVVQRIPRDSAQA